jgi:hypothetical protein
MNWMTGFTMGLMLGMTILMSAFAAQRRGQQQRLEALLQNGAYRLLKTDGSPVPIPELLAALNVPVRTKRQQFSIVVALLVGFFAAFFAFRVLSNR